MSIRCIVSLLPLLPAILNAQPVNLRTAVAPGTRIIATFNAGRVSLSTWSRDSIAITGVARGGKVNLTAAGDSVVVQQREGEAQLTIHVPQNSSLEVRSAIAGVTVSGVLRTASVRTTSGQVIVDGRIAELSAHTVTGQIRMAVAASRVTASSFTGQLTFRTTAAPSQVTLHNHSGQIIVEVPRQFNIAVNAATVHGRVIHEQPVVAQTNAVVRARTYTGHILIREEP